MDTKGGKEKTTQNTGKIQIMGSIEKTETEKLEKHKIGKNGKT